jgi:uncharacterized protein involved in exopolysaccharide biosynthesis
MRKHIITVACISIYAIGVTGCAYPMLTERLKGVEQRLDALEQRLDNVEASSAKLSGDESKLQSLHGTDLPLPHRSKAELHAQILRLEQQKVVLLDNVKPRHPAILDIDRQILILKRHLETLIRTTSGVSEGGT